MGARLRSRGERPPEPPGLLLAPDRARKPPRRVRYVERVKERVVARAGEPGDPSGGRRSGLGELIGGSRGTRPAREELASLSERLAVVQVARILIAVTGIVMGVIVGDNDARRLIPLAAVYVLVTGLVELARRRAHRRGLFVVSLSLLVDGCFLVVAVALTGGDSSPLLFLIFLQVMAVTLLVSYRTGLKVALWYVLLLFVARAAAKADVVGFDDPGSSADLALFSAGLLLFTVATAAFSSVNERALRASRNELRGLLALGGDLEGARSPDDVMLVLGSYVCARLGFTRAVVIRRDDDGWCGGLYDGQSASLVSSPGAGGEDVERALTSTEPLLREDVSGDPLLGALLPGARNVVLTTLSSDGETLGLIVAEWGEQDRGRISSLTVDTLKQAAQRAALTWRNTALLSEVERLATRDGLTGLANRRLFEETLEREVARALRRRLPLALVVLDVDFFKNVNDTFGHQAGDQVLRQVADATLEHTKASDLAARYGGDEFVVLLPECDGSDAHAVAERLRTAVAERASAMRVTVSAGTASLPENASAVERLVAAADAALYEAKRAGRDRTVRSSRTHATPATDSPFEQPEPEPSPQTPVGLTG